MQKKLLFLILVTLSSFLEAQTVTFHEDFSDCIQKIAIDIDNDLLWMGTGLSSGGNLFMRDQNGNRTDLSELTSDIDFQSISVLFMDESTLFAGGYQGIAVIDPEVDVFEKYTPDNSDLSFNSEFSSLVYDYNSDFLYAGNIVGGTDILSEDGWTQDNSLSNITASTFDYENDCLWLASTSGKLIKIKDEERTIYNSSNSELPNLSYVDMTADDAGNIYLLAYENGFVHFDGTNAKHYTPENSNLFGGDLNSIDIDLNGKVWFGHNGGITSFKNEVFHTFPLENYIDFFPIVNDIVVDNNNHLWLGACGGLIEFSLDPTSTSEENVYTSIVSPNPNSGSFEFIAIEKGMLKIYNQLGQRVYSQPIQDEKSSVQTNLPTGHYYYQFEGIATSESGKLNIN